MSEDTIPAAETAAATDGQNAAPTPAGAQNTEATEGASEKAVPYARFKEINDKLKMAEKRVAELETADKARQKAALSEVDRLKAEAAEWKQAAEGARGKVRELSLRQAFRMEAEAQKLKFATEQAAADAFSLLDVKEIVIDDEGKVTGLKEAMKELARSRPYLFAQEKPTNIDAAAGMGRPDTPTDSAAKEKELRQRFRF